MTFNLEAADRANTIIRLLRRHATRNLKKILENMRAEDIADVFRRTLSGRWQQLFDLIQSKERQAELLAALDAEIQQTLLETIGNDDLAALMALMSSDDAADILCLMPEERAGAISAMVRPDDDLSEALELLRYDPDTAGGLMVPLALDLPASMTVADAIAEIQRRTDELEMVFYLYVIDDEKRLVGVCSLRDLVITPPETSLAAIMETDVIRVATNTDQEEVAQIVARYDLLAVPVVDDNDRLMGIVTVDDIIDVIRAEATEDMLKMAGVGEDADVSERRGAFIMARARIPWLFASFVGGVLAVFVIATFESALQAVAALAAFIPVTIGMGGNVGTQSATIVTRGLALGRIEGSRLWAVVRHELLVGVLCGLVYGLLLGAVVAVIYADFPSPWQLSATVGLSILAAMSLAAFVGGMVPLLFERFGIDPAIAAGPFVTTSVDVLGILAYFMIAQTLLGLD